jgi:hypothetical protein
MVGYHFVALLEYPFGEMARHNGADLYAEIAGRTMKRCSTFRSTHQAISSFL